MSVSITNHHQIYKSKYRFKGEDPLTRSRHAYPELMKQGDSAQTGLTQGNSVQKDIIATAESNFGGRLSFKGNIRQEAAKKVIGSASPLVQKIAKSGFVVNFVEMAQSNMLLFEAAFALLITCGFRPLLILSLPTKDKANKEKNKKAASHSIASGIIGYGFALAISLPLTKAIGKINRSPEKYLSKATLDFLKNSEKSLADSKRYIALRNSFTKIPEAVLMPIRAIITIALIPLIDKKILNKVFKTGKNDNTAAAEQKQVPYMNPYASIYFKGQAANAVESFKKFKGGIA